MAAPSYKRVNYTLRPAKNIERKMFAECFSRLAVLAPLKDYRYVGFGSTFFNDFSLYHELLGVTDMLSIEREVADKERFEFNRPYRCIRMKWGESSEVLPTLSWRKRSIVWLDYDSKLSRSVLDDVSLLVATMRSGSVLIVTVDAEPERVPVDEETGIPASKDSIHEIRLRELRARVGRKMVPSDVKGASLRGWGLASVSYRLLANRVRATLRERNGALADEDRVEFKQLLHVQYADGARMLSFGGVLLNPRDEARIDGAFSDLPFVRDGRDPLLIRPPILTGREVRHLDQRLPELRRGRRGLGWIDEKAEAEYADVYRYYPIFAEAEL